LVGKIEAEDHLGAIRRRTMARKRGTVIELSEFSRRRILRNKDINEALAEAIKIQSTSSILQDGIVILTQDEATMLFHSGIIKALKKKGLVDTALFQCSSYSAKLLASMISSSPRHLVATEFLKESMREDNPYLLQQGADVCFLISSVFTERGHWRAMKIDYYRDMGTSLYDSFYNSTYREIGFYMGQNFHTISMATNECIMSLRNR